MKLSRRGFLSLLAAAPAVAPVAAAVAEEALCAGTTLVVKLFTANGDYIPGKFMVPQNPFPSAIVDKDYTIGSVADFEKLYRQLTADGTATDADMEQETAALPHIPARPTFPPQSTAATMQRKR